MKSRNNAASSMCIANDTCAASVNANTPSALVGRDGSRKPCQAIVSAQNIGIPNAETSRSARLNNSATEFIFSGPTSCRMRLKTSSTGSPNRVAASLYTVSCQLDFGSSMPYRVGIIRMMIWAFDFP